jgi:hypothetical protein
MDMTKPPGAPWTLEQELGFDIGYSLPRVAVRGLRRAFTEDERRAIATGIVEHLKLCRWRFERDPPPIGHPTKAG